VSLDYLLGNDLLISTGVDLGLFNFLRRSIVLPDLNCFFSTPLDLNAKLIVDCLR
jgi:hypothetical protein